MRDVDPISVLADDFDPVGSSFELIVGPWLLSLLAVRLLIYVAGRNRLYARTTIYRDIVLFGTWLFYIYRNVSFLDGEIGWSAAFILLLVFFPIPLLLIPCTVYYVSHRLHDTRRDSVVVVGLAGVAIAAQICWLNYLMADAA